MSTSFFASATVLNDNHKEHISQHNHTQIVVRYRGEPDFMYISRQNSMVVELVGAMRESHLFKQIKMQVDIHM